MFRYVIYRHGWDETNQSEARGEPETMAVLRVEANSPEDACRVARQQVPLGPNQRLSAQLAAVVDAQEDNRNLKAEALEP